MEFITDNLFIIIPVAVILVFRAINASRKREEAARRAAQEEQATTETYPAYDDEDDEPDTALMHWEVEKKAEPVIQPAPVKSLVQKFQEPVALPASSLSAHESPPPVHVSGTEKINALQKINTPGHQACGSLSSLEQLPLLKKAFVFSEILAAPKALRDE